MVLATTCQGAGYGRPPDQLGFARRARDLVAASLVIEPAHRGSPGEAGRTRRDRGRRRGAKVPETLAGVG
jgi:hypothetical protein